MPTVRENITYVCERYALPYQGALRRVAKAALVIVLVALLLEVFAFNFNFFASRNLNTVSLNDRLELQETSDGMYRLTETDHVMEFSNLNIELRNVRIDFDWGQPAQNVPVKIQFTDGAHSTYFDSTEYTAGVPEVMVSTLIDQSKTINLTTSGLVQNLRIEIVGDEVSYPLKLRGVELNAHHPFDFSMTRFLLVAGVMGLAFMFRPGSAIYRLSLVRNPRKTKMAIVAVVALEMLLATGYLFMGSNLVGVASSSYNQGSWDGRSVVNVYEVGGENAQQYAMLAEAMAKGQLYLETEPPQWLQDMEDPYDKGARDELQKETGEEYLFDVAYRDGHYYVYFGIVPVLLFYLPFYLLTGASFPTAIGVLVAVLAFMLGCTVLLDRFARYHFKRVSLGLFLLVQIPLVTCSGVLYLLKFPTFYSLPIACALAFSVWGLYLWLRGRAAENPIGFYLAGSLCMALVAGCRPQFLVLSLVAFPLFWRVYITKRRLFTRRGAIEFACLLAPYALVAAGLMWYNYARFGSLTDFGANYNLTVNDMTKRGMNVGRMAPALFAFFLQPASVTGVFPFIQAAPFETTYMGQTIKEVTFGGILACLPVLWLLPFAPRILAMRNRERETRTVTGVICVLLGGGVLVALADAQMAGILQRYFADFSIMFLMSVVLLCFIANEKLPPRSTVAVVLRKVLVVLVALSVLYSVLVCFVPETGWYSDVYPWAYQGIIEMVQFWT